MKTKSRRKRLQINGVDGLPRNLGFAGVSESNRTAWKANAQRIVACQAAGMAFSIADVNWIKAQSEANAKKLRTLGVEFERDRVEKYRLSNMIKDFLKVKTASGDCNDMGKYHDTERRLLLHFGGNTDIRSIEQSDAKEYQQFLITHEELGATSTALRATGYANSYFYYAYNQRLIERNPFQGLAKTVMTNEDKHHYICPEQTRRLWNALTNDDDRLRFVLLRYIGLRCPSELNTLRWCDFNWSTNKVRITSPKLHRWKSYKRWCPFTHMDALPVIERAYRGRKTANDTDTVFPTDSHSALTDRVEQWVSDADLWRWPSLLTNFRRSAITDALDAGISAPQVAKWYGNSERIIKKHYAMETDIHAEMLRKNSVVMLGHENERATA